MTDDQQSDPVDAALAAVDVGHGWRGHRCSCGHPAPTEGAWLRHRMEVAIAAARPLILADHLRRRSMADALMTCKQVGHADPEDGRCVRCETPAEEYVGRVHCARCGSPFRHPEGKSQAQASDDLDVCGPCETAILADVAAEQLKPQEDA